MGVYFDGGDRLQRGSGIGGFLKLASRLFSPLARVAKKALNSNTGRKLVKAVKEQAIDSSINIATDIAKGRNLKDSLEDEFENAKSNSKRKAIGIGLDYLKGNDNTRKKRKIQLKSKLKRKSNKKTKKRDIFA